MTTTASLVAQSGSFTYSSKTVKTETASGSLETESESLTATFKMDSVTLNTQPMVDPKSKVTDLKALLASAAEDAQKGGGLDLSKFQQTMKDQLIEQMKQAQTALKAAGKSSKLVDDILYAVDKDQKAADVPDEWSADKTSQRIVDFAAAFKGVAKGMSDEEFIGAIRKSIQDGFRSAKADLKELPADAAKLCNDTYEASMKKLDDLLASWKKGATDDTATAGASGAQTADGSAAKTIDSSDASTASNAMSKNVQAAPGQAPTSTFSVVA